MIAAGIGCRAGCAADSIVNLVREAERRADTDATLLAAPDFKGSEPGLLMAATSLGLTLVLVPRQDLSEMQPHCVTQSAAALAATGLASVAEAAALAAAGPGAVLILPRIAGGGATCALASAE